jgi:hypothetical protein
MKEKGVTYLYKANKVSKMKAVYTLTNKLGVPNQVLEYVKNGIDKSAIAENNPFVGFTEWDIVFNIPEEERTEISEPASNEIEDAEYEGVTEKPADESQLWADNQEAILNKYPDFTEEMFNQMSPEEKSKLIECL